MFITLWHFIYFLLSMNNESEVGAKIKLPLLFAHSSHETIAETEKKKKEEEATAASSEEEEEVIIIYTIILGNPYELLTKHHQISLYCKCFLCVCFYMDLVGCC